MNHKLTPTQELGYLQQYQETGDTMAFKQLKFALQPTIRKALAKIAPMYKGKQAADLIIQADGELPGILNTYQHDTGDLHAYVHNEIISLFNQKEELTN